MAFPSVIDKLSTPLTAPAPDGRTNPSKIENAAKQFESLLIAQILKGMHEAGSSGWLGGGEDEAGESAMQLAEEQFAQALSSRGGLGLSRLITQGLTTQTENSSRPPCYDSQAVCFERSCRDQ
jgi:Rod binding domain-containing protein